MPWLTVKVAIIYSQAGVLDLVGMYDTADSPAPNKYNLNKYWLTKGRNKYVVEILHTYSTPLHITTV